MNANCELEPRGKDRERERESALSQIASQPGLFSRKSHVIKAQKESEKAAISRLRARCFQKQVHLNFFHPQRRRDFVRVIRSFCDSAEAAETVSILESRLSLSLKRTVMADDSVGPAKRKDFFRAVSFRAQILSSTHLDRP